MFWVAVTGIGILALAAGQQQCAQAGGNTREAKRRRALKRMSPQARARAVRASAGQRPVRKARPRPRRAPIRCQKLPWLSEAVEHVALDVIDDGELRPGVITRTVLEQVYPVTPEGEPIGWPTVPDDCAALRLLEARTETRVRRYLATQADLLAEQHYQA